MSSQLQRILEYQTYVYSRRERALQRFNDAVHADNIELMNIRYSNLMAIEEKLRALTNVA